MGKANGIVVHLNEARHWIFLDALNERGDFAEAVEKFSHSRSSPLICFVINTQGLITHIARGCRGRDAGTNQSRLNLSDIMAMTTTLTVTDIIEGVPKRNRKPVEDRFQHGGLLSPRAFEEVIELVACLAPETKSALERFSENTRRRISGLSSEACNTLAYQKESVASALNMAGMDRSELSKWTLDTEEVPTSFLEGLPQVRLREDPMIIHDMMDVPGYDYLRTVKVASSAVFQDGDNRLTVTLANRLPLERQTGCDLIYYNQTFKAFIMVQYKAMEPDDSKGAIFRFPEKKLTEEIQRMDAFLVELAKAKPTNAVKDFRLNSDPFYLKFCPRIQFDPDSTGLTKGMCIPLSYWKRLAVDDSLKGPKGGRRLAYSNVGRYFDNTSFATMIKGAWIGTSIPQSKLMKDWMREVISSGRSITFAVKSNNTNGDHSIDDVHVAPDFGLDGVEENSTEKSNKQ